jgi:hypothetical protein
MSWRLASAKPWAIQRRLDATLTIDRSPIKTQFGTERRPTPKLHRRLNARSMWLLRGQKPRVTLRGI